MLLCSSRWGGGASGGSSDADGEAEAEWEPRERGGPGGAGARGGGAAAAAGLWAGAGGGGAAGLGLLDDDDDDIILIAPSDDESGDEADRAALRRFVQAEDDPRFRAALAAAQAAFNADAAAAAGAAAAPAAAGWEGPDDEEDDEFDFDASEGPGGLGSFGADEVEGSEDDDGLERVLLVGMELKSQQQAAAASAARRRRGGGSAWARDADGGAGGAEGGGGGGRKGGVWRDAAGYTAEESLAELGRLADTAGLKVVGSTHQVLESPNNATYIGSGKVAEVARTVAALGVDTVIFDDELSPGQLRNLEKAFSGDGRGARVADRTALILDIFSQRARTREGMLQVELAQTDYQLPRLTRMWTHLDRVAGGGQVKGAGEKQIEIDKRLLRDKAAALRRELQEVRRHRAAHRERRGAAPIPVVALVGYTNAGKSTLLNTLTQAGVLAEDKLFATLDPTTRKVRLRNNLEVLFSDTVGFIQKLPPQLVAAFTATLEEIADAGVVLHVLDASAHNAVAQCDAVLKRLARDAVLKVLDELRVHGAPVVTAWNKIDACPNPDAVRALAAGRSDTVVISGETGEGVEALLEAVADTLAASMVDVEALLEAVAGTLAAGMVDVELLLPYSAGDLLDDLHTTGHVRTLAYEEGGARVSAAAPRHLLGRLRPYVIAGSGDAAEGGGAWGGAGWGDEGRGGFAVAGAEALWDAGLEGLEGVDLEGGGLLGLYGLEGAGGGGEEEGDEALLAAARHLENQQRQAAAASGGRRGGRRGGGGDAARAAGEEAGSRRLFAHRLPADWDEAVRGGAAEGAAAPAPAAALTT
ncbi:MAG: hypothetical protein J3K34DRAFT_527703 [Monoraphidium minutum]|nr:MAG: hypothetical protein J3K34DRAFT_527703 [Monoraphidium minutum]